MINFNIYTELCSLVLEKGVLPYDEEVRMKVLEQKRLVGQEAVCVTGKALLQKMQEAQAITLSNDEI